MKWERHGSRYCDGRREGSGARRRIKEWGSLAEGHRIFERLQGLKPIIALPLCAGAKAPAS
jgi:hypothetical protein